MVDLSVQIDARSADKAKVQASGTLEQTITVTNHSNETATGVVVGADLQNAMDFWEPHQSYTEYGTSWVNASTAEKMEDRFFGNPETVDSTNGKVTIYDDPMPGIRPEKQDINIENLDRGELTWELGTPLAPGESATLTYYGQRTFEKVGGIDFHHNAYVKHVDQHDENPHNDRHKVEVKFETPLVIDLGGNGVQTLSVDEGVEFDLLNTGEAKVQTGWVSGEDALLAIDNNNNGVIDDRSELFGGEIGEGFAKLATFDSNDDGVVDGNDVGFSDLLIWQDADEDALTDGGELLSLESAGVASLDTSYTNVFNTDVNGNVHGEHGTATLANGSAVDLVDVYFQVEG